ncbi:MAG TPA: ABC transporter permease [Candidatus Acidoferrum sp.]|jgi:predicted permease
MFRRKRTANDFSAEIEEHIRLERERWREQGMSEEEARTAARRTFGNVMHAEERFYESGRWMWLEHILQDIRYGLRMMTKSPGFTAVAVLTLALGIGANTAIFSLIDAVMLKMLPVQKPQELMLLAVRAPRGWQEPDATFSNPVWEEIRKEQDVFSGMFSWSEFQLDLAPGGESHNVNGVYVSGDFFGVLGVRSAAGRLLGPSDDVRGCSGAAVLSYDFWQRHYGGAESAVGEMIRLDQHLFPIVGVAARGFFGVDVGKQFDVAVPICAEGVIPVFGEPDGAKFLNRPSAQWLRVMARPKAGVSKEAIGARLRILSPGIFAATTAQEWTGDERKEFLAGTLQVLPGGGGISDLRRDYSEALELLMAVVGLVLLIACANIASLMLARAAGRRKEIAVRLAVGASRSRVIRQLLTECVLLSVLGALLGVVLARWGCALLVRFLSTADQRVFLEFALDGRVLGFTTGIAIVTGLFFGVFPALRSTRVSPTAAMKGAEAAEGTGKSHQRAGRWIVISQVALSLLILITAGLFLRSFRNLLTLDVGFDRNHVLLIETSVPHPDLPPGQRAMLYKRILERLSALPGTISASESLVTPISGEMWGMDFHLVNGGGPAGEEADAYMNFVSPGYFSTFHSSILDGRNFDEHDVANAQPVVIINETMARKFFPGSRAIGQYLVTRDFMNDHRERMAPPREVIGILKDTKYRTLREDSQQIAYLPIAQAEVLSDPAIFEIRTAGDPALLARAAGEAIAGLNKNISLNFRTLESQVDDSLQRERLLAILSGFFGGLALVLAMIGLYGVLAYRVTQRRKELGIRLALGAQRSAILRLILRDVTILLLFGIAGGVGISLWTTQLTRKLLFALNPRDFTTILFSALMLTSVALIAGYLPARRAIRTDPMIALRDE